VRILSVASVCLEIWLLRRLLHTYENILTAVLHSLAILFPIRYIQISNLDSDTGPAEVLRVCC